MTGANAVMSLYQDPPQTPGIEVDLETMSPPQGTLVTGRPRPSPTDGRSPLLRPSVLCPGQDRADGDAASPRRVGSDQAPAKTRTKSVANAASKPTRSATLLHMGVAIRRQ